MAPRCPHLTVPPVFALQVAAGLLASSIGARPCPNLLFIYVYVSAFTGSDRAALRVFLHTYRLCLGQIAEPAGCECNVLSRKSAHRHAQPPALILTDLSGFCGRQRVTLLNCGSSEASESSTPLAAAELLPCVQPAIGVQSRYVQGVSPPRKRFRQSRASLHAD